MARLPRDIQAALDRLEPAIRDGFLEAIDLITSAAQLNRLIAEIEAGRIEEAIEALRIEQGFFGPLSEAKRQAYLEAGVMVLAGLRLKDPFYGDRIVIGFDGRAVRAERWARDQSSKLITSVIETQKESVRIVIKEGLETGQHPRNIAREIVGRVNPATGKREGGLLGLDRPRAGVFRKVMKAMQTPEGIRSLVTVPKDGSPPYVTLESVNKATKQRILRAFRAGEAASAADIEISRKQLLNKLLKDRGDTIARHETLNAMRAGSLEGYRQLVESGKVRDDQIERTWDDTGDERVRDDHRLMDGQKVIGIERAFVFPDGSQAMFPGDDSLEAPAKNLIQCRCWMAVRIKRI